MRPAKVRLPHKTGGYASGLGGREELEQIRAGFGPKDPTPAIRYLVEHGAAEIVTSRPAGRGG